MPTEQPTDLVRSVSRALRVLEEVGRSPHGANAKRIARRCELHLSTTYHLLRTLCYEGYLERLPCGDYVLGLKVADRFHDLVAAITEPPPVAKVLRGLSAATGHSAYTARFVRGVVTVTETVEGAGSPPVEDLLVGFDEGAHATALGKALLSTLPAGQRRSYLGERGLRPFTPRTVREPEALEAELWAMRSEGVFVEEGQYRSGISCASMLVRVGEQWAALALSATSGRLRSAGAALLDPLRTATADLRHAIVAPA